MRPPTRIKSRRDPKNEEVGLKPPRRRLRKSGRTKRIHLMITRGRLGGLRSFAAVTGRKSTPFHGADGADALQFQGVGQQWHPFLPYSICERGARIGTKAILRTRNSSPIVVTKIFRKFGFRFSRDQARRKFP